MNSTDRERLETARTKVATPLGGFVVEASEWGLRSVTPGPERNAPWRGPDPRIGPDVPAGARAAAFARAGADLLERYARGESVRYEGPLDIAVPAFHRSVWDRVRAIPYGDTVTYGEIAADLGLPGEARAVGVAVAANPVCILVPCHRVVAADGSLRGFAWGLELKRRLLAHEGSRTALLFPGA